MLMDYYLLCERPGIIDQLSSVGCVNDLEIRKIRNLPIDKKDLIIHYLHYHAVKQITDLFQSINSNSLILTFIDAHIAMYLIWWGIIKC